MAGLDEIVEERLSQTNRSRIEIDTGTLLVAVRGQRPPYGAIRELNRVLVISQCQTTHLSFACFRSNWFSHTHSTYSHYRDYSGFCVLQSRPHEVWARFFDLNEGRLRYTASDCFETFPFPEGFRDRSRLESAGQAYYEFRADRWSATTRA